jgi:Flp pilus assembly protein TadD
MNDLAWILATHPDSSVRNGTQAVKLAEAACRLDPQQARFWGTLDAAYAESGRFEEAIATAERAAKLATSQGLNAISEAARDRLKRYRTAQPFRQGSAASNGAR